MAIQRSAWPQERRLASKPLYPTRIKPKPPKTDHRRPQVISKDIQKLPRGER